MGRADRRSRPAHADDLVVVVAGKQGGSATLATTLAQRWRALERKVLLVLCREPSVEAPPPPGLRWAVLERSALLERLADPAALLAEAERWRHRHPRPLNVPSSTGVHVVDLGLTGADDLLGVLSALGPRPGRLIVTSDPAVLGRATDAAPRTEECPVAPEDPRAEALVAAEAVARQASAAGRAVVALRITPYVYGPGIDPHTPLGPDRLLVERLLRRHPILWASGLTPTQPLHVSDLAAALERLLQIPAPQPLYHLAGPQTLGWGELLRELHRASGSVERPVVETLTAPELAQRRPQDTRAYMSLAHLPVLDTSRADAALGAPRLHLREAAPEWLADLLQRLGVHDE